MYIQPDPTTHWDGHAVRCDTQIGAAMQTRDLRYCDTFTVVHFGCGLFDEEVAKVEEIRDGGCVAQRASEIHEEIHIAKKFFEVKEVGYHGGEIRA